MTISTLSVSNRRREYQDRLVEHPKWEWYHGMQAADGDYLSQNQWGAPSLIDVDAWDIVHEAVHESTRPGLGFRSTAAILIVEALKVMQGASIRLSTDVDVPSWIVDTGDITTTFVEPDLGIAAARLWLLSRET